MNTKIRLLHFAAAALGALITGLTVLQKVPKYSALAGGLLLVIADAKKVRDLFAAMFKATAVTAVALVCLASSLVGCAHVTAVETQCNVTAEDAVHVIVDIADKDVSDIVSEAPKDLCVVEAVADQIIAAHKAAGKSTPMLAKALAIKAATY